MPKSSRIKDSLRFSFLDGVFASCMIGLTGNYLVAYVLALGATSFQVGLLTALPSLAAALVQLKSADIAERLGSRKSIIIWFVLAQAMFGLLIVFIPYIFKAATVLLLVIAVAGFSGSAAFAGPAWQALMSEYIPVGKRGRYFGWRNKILGSVTLLSAYAAGIFLESMKTDILRGFLIIFSTAVACRLISWGFLWRMYDPGVTSGQGAYFSFWDFIRRLRSSNFARFVVFVASLHFCVNLAAPFFSVLMLRDWKFNYLLYTVLVNTATLSSIFTIGRWGRHSDRVGNVKVLRLTSFIIASLPLWWVLWRNPFYLFAVETLSGFAWAGFNLCAVNFIYDAVTPAKRVRCFAYFNVFVGLATCGGALTGGLLVNVMPAVFGLRILGLFLLASLLRFMIAAGLSRRIKEVRHTEQITSRNLFYSILGLRPLTEED
jgi:MFS family permease